MFGFRKTKTVGVYFASGAYREKYAFKTDAEADVKLGDQVRLDEYIDESGKTIVGVISRLSEDEAKMATKRLKGKNLRTGERLS